MITLKRAYLKDRTEGVLTLPDGQQIFTLERPWLNNKVNESCIKEGVYIVDRDLTGKHRFYRLRDVEDRTDIEIHPANRVSQLLGCIAPCMSIKNGIGVDSIKACELLLHWFGDDSWSLKIE